MAREKETVIHDELDIADLEIRYIRTNDLVLDNEVNLRRAIDEGLCFKVSISNPELVPDGLVSMTLVIAKDRRNCMAGASGNFRKNPHATIVQDTVTISGANPATAEIDLIHDHIKARAILWHEGGGPYDVTMSVAPANSPLSPTRSANGNSAQLLNATSHTAHVFYHFTGV
jgi:hypothetical protein